MPPTRARNLLPLLLASLTVPLVVRAQSGQEKIIQERLERAGTLEYVPAGKAFSADAAVGSRRASVRSFAFGGRMVNSKAGDDAFNARSFNDGRGRFRTENYAVKQALAGDRQALPQGDRSFATRPVDVREDRAANRSLDTSRSYADSGKPFSVPGKRQETIDDLRKQKNLTVDQVREILNKNR